MCCSSFPSVSRAKRVDFPHVVLSNLWGGFGGGGGSGARMCTQAVSSAAYTHTHTHTRCREKKLKTWNTYSHKHDAHKISHLPYSIIITNILEMFVASLPYTKTFTHTHTHALVCVCLCILWTLCGISPPPPAHFPALHSLPHTTSVFMCVSAQAFCIKDDAMR